MVQVERDYTLDYDDMSAFLREIDTDWDFELSPIVTIASVTSISPKNRSKKPRRYPKVGILNARKMVTELELQLQILTEKHAFCEPLRAAKSDYDLNWSLYASREGTLMKTSGQVNARLRKRVDDNTRQIQRISRLVNRFQIGTMPRSWNDQIVNLDNETHVRRVLRACLDSRSKHQVDLIVRQCSEASEEDLQSSAFINGGMNCRLSLDALGVSKHDGRDVPKGRLSQKATAASDATALDRRIILHRLVQARNCTIMLWENAFCWQNSHDCSSVMVRGSVWVLIAPVSGHKEEMSLVHSGGLFQIHTRDRSRLEPSDKQAKDIVAYAQLMQRSQITSLEHVLINRARNQRNAKCRLRIYSNLLIPLLKEKSMETVSLLLSQEPSERIK